MQARGVRLRWSEVPAGVRAEVEAILGAGVVEAVNQPDGFSPGVAARCVLADGRRVFLKAVSTAPNPDSPRLHRREARITAELPRELPVPRLVAVHDDGSWVVLALEDIEGTPPAQPWVMDDLAATFAALDELNAATDPCPVPNLIAFADGRAAPRFDRFGHATAEERSALDPAILTHLDELVALEQRWRTAATGEALVHADIRADNLVVRADGSIAIVDWPWASLGAWWIDRVFFLPSVGLAGPAPADVETALDPLAGAPRDDVDAVLAALTGFFCIGGTQPDPPGLPTVRAFQRAQGRVAFAWLAHRRGWS